MPKDSPHSYRHHQDLAALLREFLSVWTVSSEWQVRFDEALERCDGPKSEQNAAPRGSSGRQMPDEGARSAVAAPGYTDADNEVWERFLIRWPTDHVLLQRDGICLTVGEVLGFVRRCRTQDLLPGLRYALTLGLDEVARVSVTNKIRELERIGATNSEAKT